MSGAVIAAVTDVLGALKQGGLQAGSARGQNRMRSVLVMVEIALSLTLLVGCGLLLRTLSKLRSVDAGFDTSNILLVWMNPEIAGYDKTQMLTLYDTLQQRLASVPGVKSASYSSTALLSGSLWTSSMKIVGRPAFGTSA